MQGLMADEDLKLIYIHPASVLAASGAKPPQYVIYHELVFTARPFMRHVLGVERSWLMECRSRIGKVSLVELSGGKLEEVKTAVEDEDEGGGGKEGKKMKKEKEEMAEAAPVVVKEKTSQEAVAAARARFLARKGGGGGK